MPPTNGLSEGQRALIREIAREVLAEYKVDQETAIDDAVASHAQGCELSQYKSRWGKVIVVVQALWAAAVSLALIVFGAWWRNGK